MSHRCSQSDRPSNSYGISMSLQKWGMFSGYLKSQVVLLQTAHSWANAGVLLGARMHRERGSFRSN